MTLRKFLPVLLLAASTLASSAQDREIAGVSYSYAPLKNDGTRASIQQVEARIRFPVSSGKKSHLMGSVTYRRAAFNDFGSFTELPLQGISTQLAWQHQINGNRQILLFAQTGVFSDLADISGKDVRSSAGFRYRVRQSPSVKYGFGLAYARQFFGNQIIPFIDFDWQPGNRLHVYGQFPVKPRVEYSLADNWVLGTGLLGEASSYRLSAKNDQNQFVQNTQWGLNVYAERTIHKSLILHVGTGSYLKRSFRKYNDTDHSPWTVITVPLGTKPDPVMKADSRSWFFELGVSYTLFARPVI